MQIHIRIRTDCALISSDENQVNPTAKLSGYDYTSDLLVHTYTSIRIVDKSLGMSTIVFNQWCHYWRYSYNHSNHYTTLSNRVDNFTDSNKSLMRYVGTFLMMT